jgi:hypothetical protein
MELTDAFEGSMTFEVKESNLNALPKPTHLHIMLEGTDDDGMLLEGFRYVVIHKDGVEHTYSADDILRLLREYEVGGSNG